MTLHMLKEPVTPLALRTLSSQSSARTTPIVVVLLSPNGKLPDLPMCTIYRVTENGAPQSPGNISYDRLVAMLFEADRVVTW